jgi:site-specific DNA recombinase
MASRRTPTAPAPLDAGPRVVRVAFYRRASTDEGNQPFSLDAQELRLRPYAESHPDWVVVGDYVERASGKDIEGRPQLKKLLRDAADGQFDLVVVARIDRASRSLGDLLHMVEFLNKYDVAFSSASEHFDTTTPMGKMILHMLGMFAEFERGLIIRGNAAKIARGLPLTGKVGYGLQLDEEGRVAANTATIGIVRRMFSEYVNDELGTKAIAMGLNANQVPGPAARPWSADSVSRLLRNRAFVGELWHRERWHPGAHEAIIDLDLFAVAQSIADARTDAAAAASRRGDFLLTGRVKCGRCAGSYVGTSGTSGTGAIHRYYACGTARRYKGAGCDALPIPADELEERIADALLDCYADSAVFTQAIELHLSEHASRHEPLTEQLLAARTAITDKEHLRQKYQDDYEADRISAGRYETRAAELDEELKGMTAHLIDLELSAEVGDLPAVPTAAELTELHALLTTAVRSGSVPRRKAVFATLVESIEVFDVDDILPTFRLYDATSAPMLKGLGGSERAGQGPDVQGDGLQFASHRLGWS